MKFLFVVILLIAGCATAPLESQTKERSPQEARIYFLRESGGLYLLRGAPIKVNGKEVGSVSPSSYFFVDRNPGEAYITVELWDAPGRFAATLNLLSGTTYYMQVSPRSDSFIPGAALGLIGLYADSKINENSGLFSLKALDDKLGADLLKRLKQ